MRLLIVNNLRSGQQSRPIYDFIRSFDTGGDEIVVRSFADDTPVAEFLEDAGSFDVVVASGGDGTVAAICYALRYTGIPILPFPSGTANLTAMNLLSPTEAHALAKLVRTGHQMTFDLGEFEMAGLKRGFTMMAGVGLDAAIMKTAASLKARLGQFAYYQAALNNIITPQADFSLTYDGQETLIKAAGVLAINFSKIQNGLSFTHHNLPRDGRLDIAVLRVNNMFELLPALGAAVLDADGGVPGRSNNVDFIQTAELRGTCTPAMNMQYDGEPGTATDSFTIRALPGAVTFIVSDEGFDAFATAEEKTSR